MGQDRMAVVVVVVIPFPDRYWFFVGAGFVYYSLSYRPQAGSFALGFGIRW